MLGDSSSVLGSSGDAVAVPVAAEAASAAAAAPPPHEGGEVGGVVGSNSGEEDRGRVEDGDRSFGGNRWPRQETLALLKIRSDMDVTFRDASVKGPLWEDVSRKLAELGFHRNAKKCKEKFENVYKYHKRTKEGRTGKSDGKTYRFFDQLQALENHPSLQSPTRTPTPTLPKPAVPTMPMAVGNPLSVPQITTVPSTTHSMNNISQGQGIVTPATNLTMNPTFPPTNPTILPIPPPPTATNNPPQIKINPSSFQNISADLISNSTSSSTSSDEHLEGLNKRKRKWKDFFERLMMEVIEKQEVLQNKFLEAIEKREHERMAREEAWRVQEMARINREREILAQERSIAAAKDAAVMAFLQKISDQHPNPAAAQALNNLTQPALPTPPQSLPPRPQPHPQPSAPSPLPIQPAAVTCLEISTTDNGENFTQMSSSRWPKVEVQALINLRTSLDSKYQENGPKGPLWEEISAAMKKIGYNRSSKRCKEKWENINKYFKKVKESNKKRPEDSKTCPYFHQLEAIYRERNKFDTSTPNQIKPENTMVPIMVQPEQQWPPQREINQTDAAMESDPMDQTQEDDEDDKDEDEEEEEEEDEEGGNNYEIVASKPLPAASVGAAE